MLKGSQEIRGQKYLPSLLRKIFVVPLYIHNNNACCWLLAVCKGLTYTFRSLSYEAIIHILMGESPAGVAM